MSDFRVTTSDGNAPPYGVVYRRHVLAGIVEDGEALALSEDHDWLRWAQSARTEDLDGGYRG